ncbi:MAG: peptide-methionine (S)-S-oxide reductase MsrA, partial [Acetanaerobacterium sp.]
MKREIHLAGGCFWGLEEYLANLPGVLETEAGYANGRTGHPSYEQVCHEDTGHAETVRVVYDADKLGLAFLLERYFEVIDPTARNRQGGDAGRQYRTGIYYTDAEDQAIAQRALDALQQGYPKPVAIELMPLNNYCRAEEYHQRYLRKNPHGYCHIPQGRFEAAKSAHDPGKTYTRKTDEELSRILTPEQFAVTRKNATEPPFRGALTDEHRQGIYVDIT